MKWVDISETELNGNGHLYDLSTQYYDTVPFNENCFDSSVNTYYKEFMSLPCQECNQGCHLKKLELHL